MKTQYEKDIEKLFSKVTFIEFGSKLNNHYKKKRKKKKNFKRPAYTMRDVYQQIIQDKKYGNKNYTINHAEPMQGDACKNK